jgi:hypothetical protein
LHPEEHNIALFSFFSLPTGPPLHLFSPEHP